MSLSFRTLDIELWEELTYMETRFLLHIEYNKLVFKRMNIAKEFIALQKIDVAKTYF